MYFLSVKPWRAGVVVFAVLVLLCGITFQNMANQKVNKDVGQFALVFFYTENGENSPVGTGKSQSVVLILDENGDEYQRIILGGSRYEQPFWWSKHEILLIKSSYLYDAPSSIIKLDLRTQEETTLVTDDYIFHYAVHPTKTKIIYSDQYWTAPAHLKLVSLDALGDSAKVTILNLALSNNQVPEWDISGNKLLVRHFSFLNPVYSPQYTMSAIFLFDIISGKSEPISPYIWEYQSSHFDSPNDPKFSPSGQRIAFTAQLYPNIQDKGVFREKIFIMDVTAKEIIRLSDISEEIMTNEYLSSELAPTWVNDHQLAYLFATYEKADSKTPKSQDICEMDLRLKEQKCFPVPGIGGEFGGWDWQP